MLGSISKFKLLEKLTEHAQSIEDVRFEGHNEKFRMKLASSFDPFKLIDLLNGRSKTVPFQATELSKA
jgi:hypothetical protein